MASIYSSINVSINRSLIGNVMILISPAAKINSEMRNKFARKRKCVREIENII